jgi:hypothetical protein
VFQSPTEPSVYETCRFLILYLVSTDVFDDVSKYMCIISMRLDTLFPYYDYSKPLTITPLSPLHIVCSRLSPPLEL